MTMRHFVIAALSACALAATVAPAAAIEDPLLNTAINEGKIGETAQGYLAVVDGATPSADARARMDQLNIRRRTAYTSGAQPKGATVEDFAGIAACTLLTKNTPVGAFYRDQGGTWRRNSGTVTLPSYCPR
jgi:hypothetical protein